MRVPHRIPTDRLVLRRHTLADVDPFAAFVADPEAVRHMAFTPEQKTRPGAERMLHWVIGAYDSPDPVFSLTIAERESDRYLGSCGLNPDPGGGLEIYYTVIPSEQRKGYATEAARAVVAYAFDELDADRLVAYVVPANVPSVRVAEKLGFVDDGPVTRAAGEAGMDHATMDGRRYVLVR